MFLHLTISPEPPMLTVRSGSRRTHGNGARMIPGPGSGPGIGCGEGTGWITPSPGFGPGTGTGSISNEGRATTGSLYVTPERSAKADASSPTAAAPADATTRTAARNGPAPSRAASPPPRALSLPESGTTRLGEHVALPALAGTLAIPLREPVTVRPPRRVLHEPELPGREHERPLDTRLPALHLDTDVPVLRHSLTSRSSPSRPSSRPTSPRRCPGRYPASRVSRSVAPYPPRRRHRTVIGQGARGRNGPRGDGTESGR